MLKPWRSIRGVAPIPWTFTDTIAWNSKQNVFQKWSMLKAGVAVFIQKFPKIPASKCTKTDRKTELCILCHARNDGYITTKSQSQREFGLGVINPSIPRLAIIRRHSYRPSPRGIPSRRQKSDRKWSVPMRGLLLILPSIAPLMTWSQRPSGGRTAGDRRRR